MNDYKTMLAQAESLLEDEDDLICAMANISALIYGELSDLNWAGFYRNINNRLVLGPFQGKVACTRIPCGKGVCGTALKTKQTQLVPNVHEFPGHIACDSASNSEIVVPVFDKEENVVAVLDIDSVKFGRFSEEDKENLEQLVRNIEKIIR